MNNVYYGNNSTLTVGCNSGYTDVGGVKYTCNNGNWVSVGRCLAKGSKTFNYTGASQTFTPPINSGEKIALTLEVWGAQGGGNGGGKGGYTVGNYSYTSGSITVWIGGKGENPGSNNNGGLGGYNGGGNAGIGCGSNKGTGGGGGGRTSIDINGSSLIIAGGGGGSNEDGNRGGTGGGNNNNGGNGEGYCLGTGGTDTTAGLSASSCSCKTIGNGVGARGGNGCASSDSGKTCPGGGGGGYYGGGAGDWGAGIEKAGSGGGGSGFCGNGASSCSGSNGVRTGNGIAIISW